MLTIVIQSTLDFSLDSFVLFFSIDVSTNNATSTDTFSTESFFINVVFNNFFAFFNLRVKLVMIRSIFIKKQRRIKKSATSSTLIEEDDKKLQLLNRKTRWLSFLFFSNFMWLNVLQDVYEKSIATNSYEVVIERTKIFDLIKEFKHFVLTLMKIFDFFFNLRSTCDILIVASFM